MGDFAAWAKTENIAVNDAIKWGSARGSIERAKGPTGAELMLTQTGKDLLAKPDAAGRSNLPPTRDDIYNGAATNLRAPRVA